MKNIENFDVIIIGAGLSGLTLAKEISTKTNYKILILEKKENLNLIRIGVFGTDQKNPFTNQYDSSWEKISVSIDDEEKILHEKEYKILTCKVFIFLSEINFRFKEKACNN